MAFVAKSLLFVGVCAVVASAYGRGPVRHPLVASSASGAGGSSSGTTGVAQGVGLGLQGGAISASKFGGTGSSTAGLGSSYGTNVFGRGSSSSSKFGGAGSGTTGRGRATGSIGAYPGSLAYGDVSSIEGEGALFGYAFPNYQAFDVPQGYDFYGEGEEQ